MQMALLVIFMAGFLRMVIALCAEPAINMQLQFRHAFGST